MIPQELKSFVNKILLGATALVVFFVVLSMFRTVELGYTDVYQNTATGSKEVYHGPDWYLSPLYVGKERTYKDETTIDFSKADSAHCAIYFRSLFIL